MKPTPAIISAATSEHVMEEQTPRPVSAEERWITHNAVIAIRVEHWLTGDDTSETYVHLTTHDENKNVCWKAKTFLQVARLELTHYQCAVPLPSVVKAVQEREKWEKENERELAEYQRLKTKFEGKT